MCGRALTTMSPVGEELSASARQSSSAAARTVIIMAERRRGKGGEAQQVRRGEAELTAVAVERDSPRRHQLHRAARGASDQNFTQSTQVHDATHAMLILGYGCTGIIPGTCINGQVSNFADPRCKESTN